MVFFLLLLLGISSGQTVPQPTPGFVIASIGGASFAVSTSCWSTPITSYNTQFNKPISYFTYNDTWITYYSSCTLKCRGCSEVQTIPVIPGYLYGAEKFTLPKEQVAIGLHSSKGCQTDVLAMLQIPQSCTQPTSLFKGLPIPFPVPAVNGSVNSFPFRGNIEINFCRQARNCDCGEQYPLPRGTCAMLGLPLNAVYFSANYYDETRTVTTSGFVNNSLSGSQIFGIVAGVLGFIGITIAGSFFLYKRYQERKGKKSEAKQSLLGNKDEAN
eukprot:TRINITY_DN1461_c0_g1_i1.p1 TRINITY_DN1461_c0_g1~~TRINITY_DN1461_c0_g1_i1.p1  ORF type:complete len:271 (+),score=42.33 TRINITY_DN1461_c0_g1_i1:78-890(+)